MGRPGHLVQLQAQKSQALRHEEYRPFRGKVTCSKPQVREPISVQIGELKTSQLCGGQGRIPALNLLTKAEALDEGGRQKHDLQRETHAPGRQAETTSA